MSYTSYLASVAGRGSEPRVAIDTTNMSSAETTVIGTRPPEEARVMRVRNTLCVEEVEASEPCFAEPPETDVTRLGEARPLGFDGRGDLPAL